MQLSYTELGVLMHTLDLVTENHFEYWVDDDGNPITNEWLERLHDKLGDAK